MDYFEKCKRDYFYNHIPEDTERKYAYLWSPTGQPMHQHVDFYEISLVTYGKCVNVYNNQKYALDRNTLLFFKSGEKHAIEQVDGLHFSFIMLPEFFYDFCKAYGFQDTAVYQQPYIARQLSNQEGEYLAFLAQQLLSNDLSPLREPITRLFAFNTFTYLNIKNHSISNHYIDRYVTHLIQNIDNFSFVSCSVKELYEKYPIANSVLINAFKKQTGKTIVEYLGDKKMEFAAQMIASNPSLSIADISNMVNISSLSHFTHKFTAYFGVTPRNYRKIHLRTPN